MARAAYSIAALIFAGLAVSAFVEPSRNWALSFGAYLPMHMTFIWLGTAVLAVIAAILVRGRFQTSEPRPIERRDLIIGMGMVGALAVLFVIFRTRFHFLGDGYALIDTYASAHPHLKMRQAGETMLHYWLTSALGGGEAGALLSFRVWSILSGVALLGATVLFARRFTSSISFWLFLLGVAAGGQMLLFFGYVEQYSIFNLAIALFLLTGLLVVREHINRFWILLPLIAAVLLHILGVILILPALYLLLPPRARKRLGQMKRSVFFGIIGAIFVVAAIGYWQLTSTVSFVGLTFLPILPHELTFDNYWLFSPSHLLDYLNLILICSPALVVLLPMAWIHDRPDKRPGHDRNFLILTSVIALLAAFVFDPKPGMPRDIDLLSFVATILTVTVWYLFVTYTPPTRSMVTVGLVAIILSVTVLSGRVMVMQSEQPAVAQLKHYLSLYYSRSRSGYAQLGRLYRTSDRLDEHKATDLAWRELYPASALVDSAEYYEDRGAYNRAIPFLQRAIELDPMYPDPYVILGNCWVMQQRFAQAERPLRIAVALNPDYAAAWNSLGVAVGNLNHPREAIDCLEHALAGDTLYGAAEYNMSVNYNVLRDSVNFRKHLRRAVNDTGLTANVYMLQLQYWAREGHRDSVQWLYTTRLRSKLNDDQAAAIESQLPGLR